MKTWQIALIGAAVVVVLYLLVNSGSGSSQERARLYQQKQSDYAGKEVRKSDKPRRNPWIEDALSGAPPPVASANMCGNNVNEDPYHVRNTVVLDNSSPTGFGLKSNYQMSCRT